MDTAEHWIDRLRLEAHPEGGHYRQTYRASLMLPQAALPGHNGDRAASTAIYFLLADDQFSAFHRLRSDEVWHFYAGSALVVHVIEPDGKYSELLLGSDPTSGEDFQAVVPAGCWFGSSLHRAKHLGTRRLHRRARLRLRRLRDGKARRAHRAVPAASQHHRAADARQRNSIILNEAKDLRFCWQPTNPNVSDQGSELSEARRRRFARAASTTPPGAPPLDSPKPHDAPADNSPAAPPLQAAATHPRSVGTSHAFT